MSTKMVEVKHEKDKFNKTGAEIRQMLHPGITEEGIPDNEPLWVDINYNLGSRKFVAVILVGK